MYTPMLLITFSSNRHPPRLIRAYFPVKSTIIGWHPSPGVLDCGDVATIPAA